MFYILIIIRKYFDMKKLFILLFILSCNISFAQIDGVKVEHRGELVYLKGGSKPYTGNVICWSGATKATETDYVNGLIDGVQILYNPNGTKFTVANYKEGKYNGIVTQYFPNGKIEFVKTYKMDFQYGLETNYYQSGQKKSEGNFIHCKEDGAWTYWFENGTIEKTGGFKDAMKEGLWIFYNDKGEKLREVIFKNDKFVSGKKF